MAIWAQSGPQHRSPFSVFFPSFPYSVLLSRHAAIYHSHKPRATLTQMVPA